MWLESLKSKSTKRVYSIHLSLFCKFHNVTPDRLLELYTSGHSVKLDNVYYDKNNEKSQQKIMLEYMKAIDALTINDEFKLRKQITEYQEKLKDVPRVEQLESQLASKIIEQDSIKKQLDKIQTDKEQEAQTMQQKHEEDMKRMREEMNQQFNQIMSMIQQNPVLAHIKPD